ncbi:TonB-dependent receptor [Psychrosphaera sp. 1_MG-2023]|uniref:TonB-dependent receptor n=1 Tax=Psychrosphaera sp. 1_MG-2023 TaxID=3062643 RepID=UPI0026E2B789|nr:TonB-dependent receptor [Psychrosphaera sp. 1_MG-2023]MDO6721254.1 TonB-dependent receptor [Psychrosphaera sp. 1_MG-2023]
MATVNRLNKISQVLRQHKGYRNNLVLTSTLLSLLSLPAFAADEDKIESAEEIEVIEVQGLRQTMTKSLNRKKNSVAIVDAVVAADFGELPGLSLSDVIENISGASGHRLKGSQNEISIRGLGSYWGYSTFNNRTITNAGPGRAVNFKKFPSELVEGVTIYKSQQADLVEGGTSGTIDVNSLRAVDYGKSQTTIQATGIYNSYYSDVEGDVSPFGAKIVASTVQQWETDSLGEMGFTFGVNHTRSSNPEENYGGNSQMGVCALRDNEGNNLVGGSNCATGQQGVSAGRVGRSPELGIDSDVADFDESSLFYVPNDAYWRTGEDEDTRTGAVFTFQWKPNDDLNINFDYEFSDLEYTENRMEFALDSRLDDLKDHIVAADRTLLYATGEARPTLQGEVRNQLDEYRGGGIDIEYSPTDDLTIGLDLSYSESYRYRQRDRTKFRSTERYNYALDFRERNVPELTWLDDNRLGPDDAGYVASDVFDASYMSNFVNNDHAYVEYRRTHEERKDDILALNFDVEYQLDNKYISSVKAGFRFSEEHLIDLVTNDVSLVISDGTQRNGASDNEDNNWDGSNPEANLALINGIMDNCTNDHVNNNLFQEEPGAGGDAANFATYDHHCFIGQILGQLPGATGTDYYDIGEREDGRDGADRDVTETITAGYVMANIDTEIGSTPVFGNVGVRVVKTETHSDGWGDKVHITSNEEFGTFDAVINPTGDLEAITLDSEYTEVLPSANLTFMVTDEFYVRAAVYRSMSRFQMNAMSAGVSYETCENEDDTICDPNTNTDYTAVIRSGDANGNHLSPYTAINYDLSLEYYPSEDAALTAAFYSKTFTGGYDVTTESRDIIVSLDGVDTVYPNVSHLVKQTSDEESTIRGVEFTGQKHFVELPEPFDGLGTKFAWNYADSDFVTAEPGSPGVVPDANLFGFSKNVASASVYWEGDQTTVRLMWKYRSKYLQPNSLPFPDRSHRYVQDATYLNMSAKYKINSNVSVFLKGLNLTNTPQVYTRGNDTTIADYSRSGAKWEFGIKAKF